MSWTSKEILAVVELIIYICVAPVIAYTYHKHRIHSITGHIYLFVFVILRLTADGLTISSRNDPSGSTTGAIINSIGLSPLLLATVGIINEARAYILGSLHNGNAKKYGYLAELILHALVVTGVALLAVGSSKSFSATASSDLDKPRALAYAGAILLLIAWIIICAWNLSTLKISNNQKRRGKDHRLARLLMTEIIISLPFTGIRIIYSVVYTFDHSPSLSPATSSFAVSFCLVFLVQLIAALILVVGLVVTRNIATPSGEDVPDQRRESHILQERNQIKLQS